MQKLGRKNIMTVIILNDDEPGTFSFDKRGYFVKESCGTAVFTVYREDGADNPFLNGRRPQILKQGRQSEIFLQFCPIW